MRQLSLRVFAAILLFCVSSTICSARTYQPNGTSTFTGAGSYCIGAVANPLTFTYTTCFFGGGASVGGACTISWYTNVTNSTALGTAILVSGPTAFNSATAATGSQTYTPPTATAGALYYFCVITNTIAGCSGGAGNTVTSSSTQLVQIDPLPAVYTVSGGGNVCTGGTGMYIDLSHSDLGINYQLYLGSVPTGAPLPGASSSLSFGPETVAGIYTVMATNTSTTCTSNMAGSATITVLPAPTQFTMTGGGGYCAGGAGVDISLSGSVAGTNYQLYNGAVAVGAVKAGTGGVLDFGIQFVAGTYSILATNTATGCTGGMSNTLTVIVNPLPNVYTISAGGSYCAGGAGVDLTLSGSDAGVNYQLYNGSTATGGVVAGGTTPLNLGFQTAAGTYTVFATNPATGCTNNMSGTATVVVNPLPTLYSMTGGGGYCAGGLGVHVGLSGSNIGINYELFDGATLVTTLAGTGLPLDFGLQTTAGNYTVVADNAVTLCTSTMTGVAVVIVNPLPNVYTISAGGSYCAGGPGVDLTLSGSDAGVNYQLYNGSTATGSLVAGGTTPLDLGFQTAAGTYTVLAINATTFCENNMTGTATIIINPLPTVFAVTGGGSYCAGGTGVHVGLSNSTVGISYQLYDGATLMNTMAGTGGSLDFGLETAAGTYTVLATNTTTFCTNNMSGSAIVVINPLPTAYTVTGGGAYCAGGTGVHVGLSNSDLGINYQLYDGATLITTLAGIGGALDFGLQTAAGTYAVVATNATTGCINPMTGNAIITVNPLPTAYTVLGGGSYCAGGAGEDVSLSWSDVGVNYQVYVSGTPIGGVVAGIGAALDFGVFATAGNYLVVATNTITGCMSQMSGSATIIINPLPAAITGTTSICVNATTTLTDATAGGTWSSNDITIATIDPSLGLMTGVASGNTTITYTLPTTCATTTPVTINALPVVAAISGVTNECVGFSNILTDATAGGIWSSTDSAIATIDAVSGTVNGIAAGTVTISYTVTNIFGCVAAATTPDTVNALPVVAAISGAGSVCVNSTATLADSSAGGVWASSDITIATIDPSLGTVTGAAAGAATITYTVTSPAGCVTFVTASETVNPLPSVTAIYGPANVCAGLSISLNDSTSGGIWSSSDSTIATVNSTGMVTGVAFGNATISYTVTNSSGCSNSATDLLAIGNAMPAVAILPAGSATLCSSTPINLVISPVSSGLTYQWTLDGNDIAGATNGSYNADTVGLFTATLNNGTCSETLTGTTVLAPPHPVIGYNSGGNFLFTGAYTTYQWYKNGTPIAGANGSILTVTGAGTYYVVVSDANGCYVASGTYTINGSGGGGGGTGVANSPSVTDVKIYPNPATSTLQIEAPVTVNVSVISPDGKMVLAQKQATSIDVSQLADGLYIIMIYDENSTLLRTEKFAKIK